jgi:hypothetical protein
MQRETVRSRTVKTSLIQIVLVRAACCLAAAVLPGAHPVLAADVEGRVLRVGLFAGDQSLLRTGCWSFVEVQLRNKKAAVVEGQLRIEQTDRDGDVATFVQEVALAPMSEWRTYQVYFIPYEIDRTRETMVRLFDRDGKLLPFEDAGREQSHLTCPGFNLMSGDHLLVVDLTGPAKLPHVGLLDMQKTSKRDFVNSVVVRKMSPSELSGRPQGLEAVDVITWDNADPSRVSPQQIAALVEWVHRGGRLLVTAGSNWQALAGSPLAEWMPVLIKGVTRRDEVQEFEDLVRSDLYKLRLARHYLKNPVTRCQMTLLPEAMPVPSGGRGDFPIVYRRFVGRGWITLIGGSLRELLPAPSSVVSAKDSETPDDEQAVKEDLFLTEGVRRVLGQNLLALPAPVDRNVTGNILRPNIDLFEIARRSISFESIGTVFLIFSLLFSIVYVGAATVGSSWFLRRRGIEQHAWTAFAIVSVVASLIGTGFVWTLRGVTKRVWQTSFVDAQAGSHEAVVTCLVGLKTPDHTRLNLRMPNKIENAEVAEYASSLRVMPPAESFNSTDESFVAPDYYISMLGKNMLERVPVRATLKEFVGSWRGEMDGKLDARLVLYRNRGEDRLQIRQQFGEDSYIRNNLGVDLKRCVLLDTNDDTAGGGRMVLEHCFELGDIPKNGAGSLVDSGDLQRRLYYKKGVSELTLKNRIPTLPLLSDQIKTWRHDVEGLMWSQEEIRPGTERMTVDQEYASLLLLSVYDLIRPEKREGDAALVRSAGRGLGCTHLLTRRTAILIGYSDDQPPVAMEVNSRKIVPQKSRTIYRFVIPVEERRSGGQKI